MLTEQKIKELRAKYNIPEQGISSSSVQKSTSESIARRRLLASEYDKQKEQPKSRLSETWEDVKQIGSNIKSRFTEGADKIQEIKDAKARGEQGNLSTGFQAFGVGAGAVSQSLGDIFTGLVKGALSQEQEEAVKNKAEETATAVMKNPLISEPMKASIEAFKNLDKNTQRNLEALFNTGMLALDVATLGGGKKLAEKGIEAGVDALQKGKTAVKEGFETATDIGKMATEKIKPIMQTTAEKLERLPERIKTNLETKQLAEKAIQELPSETAKKAARDGVEIPDIKTLTEVATSIPNEQKTIVKDLFERVKNYASTKTGARPEEIVGKPIVEALKKADELRSSVGKKLGEVAKNLGVITKDELVTPVFEKLKSVSGLNGLKLNDGILDFSKTTLASSLSKADRKAIQDAFSNAIKWGKGDRLHRFRQELFEILGGKKKSLTNITDTQEKAYNAIRQGLSDVLETKNPAYKALSKEYRNIISPLSNMRKFFKNIPDATEDILEMNAGLLARRITSNTMSGVQIKNILKDLDSVLKGKYAISTEKMQDVYNVLSKYFDISAPTGFKGQIEQAIKSGDTLFGKVTEKATELLGQTPEVRQKAIESLFKEILK